MRAVLTLLCLAASVLPAQAQTEKGRWEAAAGAVWFGGMHLGSAEATLETPGGGVFELFKTETSLDAGLGVAGTISFHATPRLALEAAFSYARPGVSTRVSADVEGAATVTSTIGLQQYLVEGSARWYVGRTFRGFQPFVRAGAGYLRQLDEHSAHVEGGTAAHAGAGVDRAFVERAGRVRRVGLRLDARAMARTGGIDIDDTIRVGASASALLFFGF